MQKQFRILLDNLTEISADKYKIFSPKLENSPHEFSSVFQLLKWRIFESSYYNENIDKIYETKILLEKIFLYLTSNTPCDFFRNILINFNDDLQVCVSGIRTNLVKSIIDIESQLNNSLERNGKFMWGMPY